MTGVIIGTLLVLYLNQHSMLLITVPTLYPTSKPAFNDLQIDKCFKLYFTPQILCLKNLAKSWSIRVKENFHEKNFDNLATPREAVLNLLSARTEAFAKSLKKGGNIDKCLPQSTFKQCLI